MSDSANPTKGEKKKKKQRWGILELSASFTRHLIKIFQQEISSVSSLHAEMSRGSGWIKWAPGFELSALQPQAPSSWLPLPPTSICRGSFIGKRARRRLAGWACYIRTTCQTALSGLFSGHFWQRQLQRLIYLEEFTGGERKLLRSPSEPTRTEMPRCWERGAEGDGRDICAESSTTKTTQLGWVRIGRLPSVHYDFWRNDVTMHRVPYSNNILPNHPFQDPK